MKKTITIQVTQEDIDKGRRGDSERCPIALAVGRAMGFRVRVAISITGTLRQYYELLPEAARYFWMDFDRGYTVSPFSFEIPAE